MRLTGLTKTENQARVEFYGCPLRCPYCTHRERERKDHQPIEVLEFLADPRIEEVYLGGAEPGIYRKELKEMLQRLSRMNKKVILKTSGIDPEFIKEILGLVMRYVVEVKCPLDDLDCTSELTGLSKEKVEKYVRSLQQSLQLLHGRDVSIWIRIIPGFVTAENIERLGSQITGQAKEVVLIQFLSNTENDAPFRGLAEPVPTEAEMVEMARRLVKFVPKVVVKGTTFYHEFGSRT